MSLTTTTTDCQTLQILDPGSDLLVATTSGNLDPTLDERGDVPLAAGQTEVNVQFTATKAGDYRFEYLYVDDVGSSGLIANPGIISVVPTITTAYGFQVELAGAPIQSTYVLRWRAVVVSLSTSGTLIDSPETIYVNLPQSSVFTYIFQNARSTQTYHFSELRVENLIDLPGQQVAILPQIVAKLQTQFSVLLSPTPPNNNYYLAAKTP